MTVYSPTATARLWIDYTVNTKARSAQFRFASASEAASAAATFRTLLAAQTARFYTSTVFTGARVAEVGTNVSNPVAFSSVTGTGTGTQALYDTPRFSTQVGRSAGGSKVRYFMYGIKPSNELPDDYRITGEEDASITTWWSEEASWIEEMNVVCADGLPPVLAGYLNVGMSAYHQRQLRG